MTYFVTRLRIVLLSLFVMSLALNIFATSRQLHRIRRISTASLIGRNSASKLYLANSNAFYSSSSGEDSDESQLPKGPIKPSRNDICRTLLTGVLGADSKEQYLRNGHYVLNFPVGFLCAYDRH
jgi:hypothetical protein